MWPNQLTSPVSSITGNSDTGNRLEDPINNGAKVTTERQKTEREARCPIGTPVAPKFTK